MNRVITILVFYNAMTFFGLFGMDEVLPQEESSAMYANLSNQEGLFERLYDFFDALECGFEPQGILLPLGFSKEIFSQELQPEKPETTITLRLRLSKNRSETPSDSEKSERLKGPAVKKVYKCAIPNCSKRFDSLPDLKKHKAVHAKIKRQPCPICGKLLAYQSITRHIRTHTGEKPYECLTCGRAFGDSTNYKNHTLGHATNKEFVCNVDGCDKAFFSIKAQRRHEKVVHKK